MVNAGEPPAPAGAEFGVMEVRVGAGNPPAGVERVNGDAADVPMEFDTVTAAEPASATSVAGMEAVSCVALTKVVAWAVPFQFTVASLVKFVPVTVSVNPWVLQYGVDAPEPGGDAESALMEGGVPGDALIVKKTTFDTSVVVVLLTFCVAD